MARPLKESTPTVSSFSLIWARAQPQRESTDHVLTSFSRGNLGTSLISGSLIFYPRESDNILTPPPTLWMTSWSVALNNAVVATSNASSMKLNLSLSWVRLDQMSHMD